MSQENPRALAEAVCAYLEDKKGEEISIIDTSNSSINTDFFVLCNGTSVTHIKSLADAVDEKMQEQHGMVPKHVEGYKTARWILMDYGDVVVHVFHKEDRAFYNLDKLWAEGLVITDGAKVEKPECDKAKLNKVAFASPDFSTNFVPHTHGYNDET